MRWFVEVSSLTPGVAGQRLTVEAATWQGALAQGRSTARDTAPLSNFTIEVLADAYRATNALTRTRYVVSRAPEDAELTGDPVAVPPRPRANPPPAIVSNGGAPSAAASALGRIKTPTGVGPSSGPGSAPILERGKVLVRKSEDPGQRSPLTYRELAVAVAEGTSKDQALAIARANFEDIRREIADVSSGRLVQLAVFDHEWQGKPKRPPLVTLTWKDWRGAEPEIKHPGVDARGMANEATAAAVEAAVAKAPTSVRPAAPANAFSPAPPVVVTPVPFGAPQVMGAKPSSATVVGTPNLPAASPPAAPVVAAPVVAAPVVAAPVVAAPVVAAPATSLKQTAIAMAPPVTAPASVKVAGDPPAGPPSFPILPPRSSRPDDLTSELFESMHDLHFMRDALDGADFVMELLREKIPTVVAMVHFYDINAKQFVVVKTRGPANANVNMKQREGTGLVGDALKSGRAIYVKDAAADARWSRDAYSQAGHASPKEIVIAPMRHGGRFLGAIEVADHSDGESFGDNEVHALSYVAEQFAEFVNERGVQITRAADSTGSFKVIESNRPPPRR